MWLLGVGHRDYWLTSQYGLEVAFLKCSSHSEGNLGLLQFCTLYYFSKHISSAITIMLCIRGRHNTDHLGYGPNQENTESRKGATNNYNG